MQREPEGKLNPESVFLVCGSIKPKCVKELFKLWCGSNKTLKATMYRILESLTLVAQNNTIGIEIKKWLPSALCPPRLRPNAVVPKCPLKRLNVPQDVFISIVLAMQAVRF